MQISSLEQIVTQFHNPQIEVISFDVFDTLLLRPLTEQDKFALLDKKYSSVFKGGSGFSRMRQTAENRLRRMITAGEIQKEDISIDEIYDEIGSWYSLKKEVLDSMKEEEFNLELKLCHARQSGKYLYEQAAALKKQIIFVTDMYLTKEQIKRLLLKNGFMPDENVFVSSEAGFRKTTGRLFDYVAETLNVSKEHMLHIGDNRVSDVEKAEEKGISAIYFPSTMEMYNSYGCGTMVRKICSDLTNWEIAGSEHGISVMRQMAANFYFDNPYRQFDINSDYNSDPYFVGYGALGMEVLSLVLFLIDNAVRDGAKKIVFLSRDGYLPMQIYKIIKVYEEKGELCLQGYSGKLPDCGYLYTSRIALLPVIIKSADDIYDIPVDITYHSPESMLGLLHFCSKQDAKGLIAEVLEKKDDGANKGKYYQFGKAFTKDTFLYFVRDFIKYAYDEEKHFSAKAHVRDYLLHNNDSAIEDKTAIFDMGYSGRIAGAIKEITDKEIFVYYFHTDGKKIFEEENLHNIKVRSFFDFSPYMESTIREYAYLKPAPSCVGYDEGLLPIFDEGPADNYEDTVNELQRGAVSFVNDFMKYFSNYLPYVAFRHHNGAMPFEAYIRYCNDADRQMFKRVEIDDELWGGRRNINIKELIETRLSKMPDFSLYPELMDGLVSWYEFKKNAEVLLVDNENKNYETFFRRKCKSVTICDAEKIYDGAENTKKYDYVVCIDNIEYADEPVNFIKALKKYLKQDGTLLITCDNRYGLKYFCGAGEKHIGVPYVGINGYYNDIPLTKDNANRFTSMGRSYSKNELEKILNGAGITAYKFYYPVPDGRMPQMIFTDDYKNGVNVRERLVDYNYEDSEMRGIEHRILGEMIDEGALPFLANTFFVEIPQNENCLDIIYAVVTSDRGCRHAMATTVRKSGKVYKRALYDEGEESLRKLYEYSNELLSKNVPIVCSTLKNDFAGLYLEMPYIEGKALSDVLEGLLPERKESFLEIFDEIYDAIKKSFSPVSENEGRVFLDLAPCNCFYLSDNETDRLLFYDQEFVDENGTVEFAMFRTIKYFFASSKKAEKHFDKNILYKRYGIKEECLKAYEQRESSFIKNVRDIDKYSDLFKVATPCYEQIYEKGRSCNKIKKPYHIGYVPGVFDLFHSGHLKLLERCKERCDILIVGVLTDELVAYYKGKEPVVSYEDRVYVINGLEVVDKVIPVTFENTDKIKAWEMLHYDCHFSGDDHINHWNDVWDELKKRGSNMEFFSYTEGISSTSIKDKMR